MNLIEKLYYENYVISNKIMFINEYKIFLKDEHIYFISSFF